MNELSHRQVIALIASRPIVVVHFDASWDEHYRHAMHDELRAALTPDLAGDVALAYVDIDREPEFAREVGIINVPALAYYRDGELDEVRIGLGQPVEDKLRRLLGQR